MYNTCISGRSRGANRVASHHHPTPTSSPYIHSDILDLSYLDHWNTCPGQRNRRRLVPVPVTGVRYNSLLWMCTLNTLTWPDLVTPASWLHPNPAPRTPSLFFSRSTTVYIRYDKNKSYTQWIEELGVLWPVIW